MLWNNQIFWNIKIKESDYFFSNHNSYRLYCYILDRDCQTGLKMSCQKGLKELVQYYITRHPNLNYKLCYSWTKKKNVTKLLRKSW